MAIGRKPSGAYDAAYPVTIPGGGTAYANATVAVDQNGNPVSGGGGGAVTIADGADVAEGATTAAAYTDQTGAASGTVVGLLKGLYTALRGIVTSGGTYTTPLPTLTNGQRSTLQLDSSGRLIVKLGDARLSRTGFANNFNSFQPFNFVADDGGSGPLNVAISYQDPSTNNGFTARGDTNGLYNVSTSSGAAAVGLAPVTAVNVSSLVVKASAGNFYGGSIVAGATAGFLIAYNAAAAPASGATLNAAQILGVVQVSANGSVALGEYTVPDRFSTGVVLLFSTSTTTYTVPANNALFLRGRAM